MYCPRFLCSHSFSLCRSLTHPPSCPDLSCTVLFLCFSYPSTHSFLRSPPNQSPLRVACMVPHVSQVLSFLTVSRANILLLRTPLFLLSPSLRPMLMPTAPSQYPQSLCHSSDYNCRDGTLCGRRHSTTVRCSQLITYGVDDNR